ncbi:ROK family protein [Candidatus Nanohalobium constans]|nr:ROK family protein [Candidatus Nanohalobium constans]
MENVFLGVDIGAKITRIGIGNSENLVNVDEIRTGDYWSVNGFLELVSDFIEDSEYNAEEIDGVGIGVSAIVDKEEKEMTCSKYLDEISFNEVEENFGIPVSLEANCNTAVIGQKKHGEQDVDNLATVNMWGGIGAGVYFDNKLLSSGNRMPAAGSIVLDYEKGLTWMDLCSGKELPETIEKIVRKDTRHTEAKKKTGKHGEEDITLEEMLEKAEEYDEVAEDCIDELAHINAVGVANVVNAYAPELITFRGTIAQKHPEFMEEIMKRVKYLSANPEPEMKVTEIENIGVKGAIALAEQNYSS